MVSVSVVSSLLALLAASPPAAGVEPTPPAPLPTVVDGRLPTGRYWVRRHRESGLGVRWSRAPVDAAVDSSRNDCDEIEIREPSLGQYELRLDDHAVSMALHPAREGWRLGRGEDTGGFGRAVDVYCPGWLRVEPTESDSVSQTNLGTVYRDEASCRASPRRAQRVCYTGICRPSSRRARPICYGVVCEFASLRTVPFSLPAECVADVAQRQALMNSTHADAMLTLRALDDIIARGGTVWAHDLREPPGSCHAVRVETGSRGEISFEASYGLLDERGRVAGEEVRLTVHYDLIEPAIGRAVEDSRWGAHGGGGSDRQVSVACGAGVFRIGSDQYYLERARCEEASSRVHFVQHLSPLATRVAPPAETTLDPPIDWVRIEGGSFRMGHLSEDRRYRDVARPSHIVRVESFEMSRAEVTFAQYRSCVRAGACTPAHTDDGTCRLGRTAPPGPPPEVLQSDDWPVVCVDWTQARAFASWVGARLPTEAEWEFAASNRGENHVYPWGDTKLACATEAAREDESVCGLSRTVDVCSMPAGDTEQGLCDMAGGVSEWTEDWFHRNYEGAPTDGSAWTDDGIGRVFRGGYVYQRSAYPPLERTDQLGFRIARRAVR